MKTNSIVSQKKTTTQNNGDKVMQVTKNKFVSVENKFNPPPRFEKQEKNHLNKKPESVQNKQTHKNKLFQECKILRKTKQDKIEGKKEFMPKMKVETLKEKLHELKKSDVIVDEDFDFEYFDFKGELQQEVEVHSDNDVDNDNNYDECTVELLDKSVGKFSKCMKVLNKNNEECATMRSHKQQENNSKLNKKTIQQPKINFEEEQEDLKKLSEKEKQEKISFKQFQQAVVIKQTEEQNHKQQKQQEQQILQQELVSEQKPFQVNIHPDSDSSSFEKSEKTFDTEETSQISNIFDFVGEDFKNLEFVEQEHKLFEDKKIYQNGKFKLNEDYKKRKKQLNEDLKTGKKEISLKDMKMNLMGKIDRISENLNFDNDDDEEPKTLLNNKSLNNNSHKCLKSPTLAEQKKFCCFSPKKNSNQKTVMKNKINAENVKTVTENDKKQLLTAQEVMISDTSFPSLPQASDESSFPSTNEDNCVVVVCFSKDSKVDDSPENNQEIVEDDENKQENDFSNYKTRINKIITENEEQIKQMDLAFEQIKDESINYCHQDDDFVVGKSEVYLSPEAKGVIVESPVLSGKKSFYCN